MEEYLSEENLSFLFFDKEMRLSEEFVNGMTMDGALIDQFNFVETDPSIIDGIELVGDYPLIAAFKGRSFLLSESLRCDHLEIERDILHLANE